MSRPKFSNTEHKLLKKMADGERHRNISLADCLPSYVPDKEMTKTLARAYLLSLRQTLVRLRPKLRLLGQDILCEVYNGKFYYRRVILLQSPKRCEDADLS